MEASAPTKKVSLKKSGTFPRYDEYLRRENTERPATAPALAPDTKYVHQSLFSRIVYYA